MKTLIIISKCLRVTKMNSQENWYEFHFKGVYSGESIKRVFLKGNEAHILKKNEEYLMYIQLSSISDGIIKGNILKYLKLNECWDRS